LLRSLVVGEDYYVGGDMVARRSVVVFHDSTDPCWRWISHHMPDVTREFVSAPTRGVTTSRLSGLVVAFRAAWAGRRAIRNEEAGSW
jgi:hypothetical protein